VFTWQILLHREPCWKREELQNNCQASLVLLTFVFKFQDSCRPLFVILLSMLRLLVTDNVVPSSLIPFNLLMRVIRSSEMRILKRTTRRHIPEDDILHSHRHENLKSYIALTGCAL
jgi:hypothetical protein